MTFTPLAMSVQKKTSDTYTSGGNAERKLPTQVTKEQAPPNPEITSVEESAQENQAPKALPTAKIESPVITPSMTAFGIKPAPSTITFPTLKELVVLPISDTQVITGLHKPPTSSFRWLAEFCRWLLWQGHQKIVVKDGAAQRVKTSN